MEKATGAAFKDGWAPMTEQVQFEQAGGDMQVSLGWSRGRPAHGAHLGGDHEADGALKLAAPRAGK